MKKTTEYSWKAGFVAGFFVLAIFCIFGWIGVAIGTLVQVCIIRVEAEQRRVRIPVRTEIRREERTVPIVIPRIEPAAMIPMMMAMTMFIWMMIMMTTGMSMMMITGMV